MFATTRGGQTDISCLLSSVFFPPCPGSLKFSTVFTSWPLSVFVMLFGAGSVHRVFAASVSVVNIMISKCVLSVS